MRAIANEMAANTLAKPTNIAAVPKLPVAATSWGSAPLPIIPARTTPRARPIGKAMVAIASIGSHSARPTRCGTFGPGAEPLTNTA